MYFREASFVVPNGYCVANIGYAKFRQPLFVALRLHLKLCSVLAEYQCVNGLYLLCLDHCVLGKFHVLWVTVLMATIGLLQG